MYIYSISALINFAKAKKFIIYHYNVFIYLHALILMMLLQKYDNWYKMYYTILNKSIL